MIRIRIYIDKVALISLKDEKLLMARSKGKDRWFVPGGKQEAGEADEEALQREIREELGVELDPASIAPYGTFEAQAHGKPEGTFVRIRCYTGSFSGEPKASSEIAEIGYLSYDQKHLTTPVDFLIFDDLKTRGLLI